MYLPQSAFQPREIAAQMQLQKLQELLIYVQANSPFYKELFAKHNVDIRSITSLQQLQYLPCTGKEDLQKRNWDFLSVSRSKVVEYTTTSGTAGDPVTIALTENDLQRLAYNEYISFLCADGQETDMYQLMLTLDRQFMAGIAYYLGIRQMGAALVRVGPGIPSMQWDTIKRLQPTVVVAVPSFLVKMTEYAKEHSIDMNATSVRKAICIGENIRNQNSGYNALGEKITSAWNIKLYSTYASTEMQTAFTECSAGRGGHHNPELVIVELLDDNNFPVEAGMPGEVTITTLGVEGMPLIRYKTGDICIADPAPCSCGRRSLRLSPVIGRKSQMIKFKGTTLYPPALFDILSGLEDVKDYVAEVYTNEIGMDELVVYINLDQPNEDADRKIRGVLQSKLRVIPALKYISNDEILKLQFPGAGRKAIKFIDKRKAL